MKPSPLALLDLRIGEVQTDAGLPALVVMHDVEQLLPRIRQRVQLVNTWIREGRAILGVDPDVHPLSLPVTQKELFELGMLLQANTLDRLHLQPCDESQP